MQPFIAPRLNLPLTWGVDLCFPLLIKTIFNLDGIDITEEDGRFLRTLRADRLLHFSNHPSHAEPAVAYAVGSRMNARFHYMATRPIFDWGLGLVGEFIRSLGAFSVLAGAADRDSIKTARGVLAVPGGKLVLYPEGMNSGENDNLLPFQPGAVQIAFWGMEDARKRDPGADITILPSFVKYVMSGTPAAIQKDLHESTSRLERTLSIQPGEKNLLRRTLTIGRLLLERKEAEYKIPPGAREDYDYRVGRVRHAILDGVAESIRLESYNPRVDAITKIRHLFAITEMLEVGFPDPRLPEVTPSVLKAAMREIRHAYDFLVMKPEYLLARPTPERFYEWLYRFESLVFGEDRPRPRRARVLFARPFKMSQYYQEYKNNKRGTVDALTARLRNDLDDLLARSRDLTTTIARPYDAGADLAHLYERAGG